ncbi:MAG TPA: hypothetical protein PK109_03660 [Candidatus Paceibacterota bacterium]|nr:hypothetical protein [Candidatus Paceibacterota bacterium]
MEKALSIAKSYWIVVLVVVLLLLSFAGYLAGYRLDQAGITRVGTLVLTDLPDGTAVYLDQARRIYAKDGTAKTTFLPGTHTVIVDAPDYQPWNELFSITAANDTVIAPVLVPVDVMGTGLTGAEATKAMNLIRTQKLPTKAAPLVVNDGCTLLSVSGPRLIADAATSSCAMLPEYLCAPGTEGCASTLIYTAKDAIRSVSPFPGRDDALVVAAGNLVFVVEVDPREPQFFAPLFKGPNIGAALYTASSTIIGDGKTVVEIPL